MLSGLEGEQENEGLESLAKLHGGEEAALRAAIEECGASAADESRLPRHAKGRYLCILSTHQMGDGRFARKSRCARKFQNSKILKLEREKSKSQNSKMKNMVLEPQTTRQFRHSKIQTRLTFRFFATALFFGRLVPFRILAFSRFLRFFWRFIFGFSCFRVLCAHHARAAFWTFHVFASACVCLAPFFFQFDFVGACHVHRIEDAYFKRLRRVPPAPCDLLVIACDTTM